MNKAIILIAIVFISVLSAKTTKPPIDDHKTSHANILTKILERFEKFMTFLCTRCTEIVHRLDDAIDNEELLQKAKDYCAKTIANTNLRAFCTEITHDVLVELYRQLKKFEPSPTLCTRLRLCDACNVNTTGKAIHEHRMVLPSVENDLQLISSTPGHYLPIYAKLSPMLGLIQADKLEDVDF